MPDISLDTPALRYHREGHPGKVALSVTKPVRTKEDLSLAYSPGVADPVVAIAENPEAAYEYTAKGNTVAVISNGTSILGLGNCGALASKPVMEGKAALFKRFADIDGVDIEVDTEDSEKFIETVRSIAPTFGGINLEDIKAPECFHIEEALIKLVNIPLMHDDQHGTAVIATAALENALDITGKSLSSISVVLSGAGSAGIAIAKMLLSVGLTHKQLLLCDSRGVVYTGRGDEFSQEKQQFVREAGVPKTLQEALKGADVFIGVSKAGTVDPTWLAAMNPKPIIFALANPDPEIHPDVVASVRPDALMATGRSDFPNQVNNALAFPYLFRAALDMRSPRISDKMKHAAAKAIATLARESVDQSVLKAYGLTSLSYGPHALLPKALDPRLLEHVSLAVAKAAMEEGNAARKITMADYAKELQKRRFAIEQTFGL